MRLNRLGIQVGLAILVAMVPPIGAQQFDESTLAAYSQTYFVGHYGTVEGTDSNVIGQSVFGDLTRGLAASYGFKPYELTILADPSPNARSVGGGKVFVNAGLVPILGGSRGLWAAVLAHELSHDLLQHAYRNYLTIVQTQAALQQAQAEARSTRQAVILALAQTGNRLLDLKVQRDQEIQADRAGMILMARAGYHPAFALELNQRLTQNLGDSTKFQAFFSDHPKMATRALRELAQYDQAEAEFSRLWPDASQSPGGVATPVATTSSFDASQDKAGLTPATLPEFWKSTTTGKEYRVRMDGDHFTAEWSNIPPEAASQGAYIRSECQRSGTGCRGTSKILLDCRLRGEKTKMCPMQLRFEVDFIAANRITGSGEVLKVFDCGSCEVRKTGWGQFTWVPQPVPTTFATVAPAHAAAISTSRFPETIVVPVASTPDGADIIVDQKFMGSTPSTLRLAPGDHTVSIEKSGFKSWQRTITVTAGESPTIKATLERQ